MREKAFKALQDKTINIQKILSFDEIRSNIMLLSNKSVLQPIISKNKMDKSMNR